VTKRSALATVHTIFMREHNRVADQVAAANPFLTDDQVPILPKTNIGLQIFVITIILTCTLKI
jgi:hypothetical protein